MPTKVEPTGKIFPVSDKALDVQRALLQRLEEARHWPWLSRCAALAKRRTALK